jgi:predicted RecB family nuclease
MSIQRFPDSKPSEEAIDLLAQLLGVGREVAQQLAAAEIGTLEELVIASEDELREVSIDAQTLRRLQARARNVLRKNG